MMFPRHHQSIWRWQMVFCAIRSPDFLMFMDGRGKLARIIDTLFAGVGEGWRRGRCCGPRSTTCAVWVIRPGAGNSRGGTAQDILPSRPDRPDRLPHPVPSSRQQTIAIKPRNLFIVTR
jgi:hypothetical protein